MVNASLVRNSGLFVRRIRQSDRQPKTPLAAYTIAQLRTYAEQNDIDLVGVTRKAQIVEAIETELQLRTDDEAITEAVQEATDEPQGDGQADGEQNDEEALEESQGDTEGFEDPVSSEDEDDGDDEDNAQE